MSKNKRGAKSSSVARPGPKGAPQRRNKLNPKSTIKSKPNSSTKPHTQASQQKPTIPFGAEDDILLIGEGTPFPSTF